MLSGADNKIAAASHNASSGQIRSPSAAAYRADLAIASAIKINQNEEKIAHNKNNIGKDIIIAIWRKDSNSCAATCRSARISLSCACRAASSALAARDIARARRRF